MSRPEHILSPSQISTFDDCERKGAFHYLAGLPDEGNTDTEIGSEFHEVLKDWLKYGTPPDDETPVGHMAMSAIKYLPVPKSPGMVVEEDGTFEFQDHGITYTGTKDLEFLRADGWLVVVDHKSCGSFNYMKTEEDLRTDPQPVLYAQHAFKTHPHIDELEVRFHYTIKGKNPSTRCVVVRVTREETNRAAATIAVRAQRILDLKKNHPRDIKSINLLPATLSTCEKFRGCPYKDVCALTPLDRVLASIEQHQKKENGTMNFSDLKAKIKTNAAAPPAPPAAPAATPPATTPTIREKLAQGINPPVATPSHTVLETKLDASLAQAKIAEALAEIDAKVAEVQALKAAAVTESVSHSLEGEDPKAIESTPKRKGRPVGSKNKPKAEMAAYYAAEALEAAAINEKIEVAERIGTVEENPNDEPPPPEDGDDRTFTLFVNCIPTRTSYELVHLSELLAPVHAAITAATGAQHYTAIKYEGRGVFAAAVKQFLEENPLSRSVGLLVNDNDPDGAACLGVLENAARVIVRGF